MLETNPMPRVLVVDDSPTQALEARQRLVRSGYSVIVAASGTLALDAIRQARPDIVLTDLMMPEMDGLELVRRIQQEFLGLPVVLMTAHGSEEVAVQALRKGAAGYVSKHNLNRDLARTLENVLGLIRKSSATHRAIECLTARSSRYVLGNDTTLVASLVGRLQDQLALSRRFNENTLMRIFLALREAVVNAMEHGNLEVSSKLRENDDDSFWVEIKRRRELEPYRSRKVQVSVRETPQQVTYVVTDEGPGFDLTALPNPMDPEQMIKACGRGLLLMRSFMDEVSHNAAGNEITLTKRCLAAPQS